MIRRKGEWNDGYLFVAGGFILGSAFSFLKRDESRLTVSLIAIGVLELKPLPGAEESGSGGVRGRRGSGDEGGEGRGGGTTTKNEERRKERGKW